MGMNVLTGEGGGRKLEAIRDVQNVDPVVDAIYRHFVSTRPLADDVPVNLGLKNDTGNGWTSVQTFKSQKNVPFKIFGRKIQKYYVKMTPVEHHVNTDVNSLFALSKKDKRNPLFFCLFQIEKVIAFSFAQW